MLMRLDEINDIQQEFSVERNDRERSYKKYNKIITTLSIGENFCKAQVNIIYCIQSHQGRNNGGRMI